MAERTTILRCVVGSQAYGTSLGSSDRDEKGICVEDFDAAWALQGEFEHYEFRTAAQRTGKKNARSEPGDLDLTIYGLKKYLKMAMGGNPNALELLFIKGDCTIKWDTIGTALQDLYPFIVSKAAGGAYLGYMKGQQNRYFSTDGEGSRQELIAQYGYDVKAAAHVIRLGLQGVELLETGRLTLPITTGRTMIMDVKAGKFTIEQCLEITKTLETSIKVLMHKDIVRAEPDYPYIEKWMQEVYLSQWNLRRGF